MIAVPRAVGVALALLAAVACGPGVGPRGPRAPSTPIDAATMRELLARYSPSGQAIVTDFEALPDRFELPEGAWTVGDRTGFDDYVGGEGVVYVVTNMTTGVHEITHGYIGKMAFQLLAERSLPWDEGALAILADDEPWLVRLTETFPSMEMSATYPADARASRYQVYVADPSPTMATQRYGVYGLLDELTAAYQGSRTAVDLWPWVRDEAPADHDLLANYVVTLDDAALPLAEFELFILHYLVHAREHRPEVYEAVLANDEFRGAFADVTDAYAALVATIATLEPTVHAFARERGLDVGRRDGWIAIGGRQQRGEHAAPYRAVLAHLDSEPYRAMLAELR